jgi:DNA polymerase III alpha subunit (gram-positive type)
MYLVFDTETTGLPLNYNAPLSDSDNWPRMVQIAWQLHDEEGKLIENQDYIIKPEGMISLLMRLEFTGFLPKWRWKKAKIWLGF